MADTFIETPAEPANNRLQLLAAVFLGLAATLTALSAYQAALLDGEALQGYTSSTRILSDANAFYAQGNSTFALDQQLFVQYASAQQAGNSELGDYLTTLMRPELSEAVDWWESTANAVTPFDEADDNPYAVSDFGEANDLEAAADSAFADGQEADDKGDKFELSTVLMALTLFFGGVATLFTRRSASVALLAVAGTTLVAGSAQLAIAFGG